MSSAAVSSAISYARENQKRFLDELKDLLRIPSVSTTEEHKGDVQKAAEMVAADLKRIGFENVEIIPTSGHPLVYADWLHAAGKPTALCYAHFDVQPAEPWDEWKSPPFIDKDAVPVKGDNAQAIKQGWAEPSERNQNIYARGAVDDKGQLWMQVKAYESLFKAGGGKLPINVRVLFEGEEEVGGEAIEEYVKKNAKNGKLKADFAWSPTPSCSRPIFRLCALDCAGWFTPNSRSRVRRRICTRAFMVAPRRTRFSRSSK